MSKLSEALSSVIASYNNGDIKPPHIVNVKDFKLKVYSITANYIKTDDKVYRLITVRWLYSGEKSWDTYQDDLYYLIVQNEDSCKAIGNTELYGLIGGYYRDIYNGKYDDYGRSLRIMLPEV